MDKGLNSKTESRDPKVHKTLNTLELLKRSDVALNEITKSTKTYADLMIRVCESAKVLSDQILLLADAHGGDIGNGLREIGDILKQIEAKRSKQARSFAENLIDPYLKGDQRMDVSKQEIVSFEKKYKATRSASLRNLKKDESTCSKLSKRKKRDQNALDNALAQLSKTVQDHDEMLADHLREAIIMQRRRYCYYIQQWNEVLLNQTDSFAEGSELIAERLGNLQTLANDMQDYVPEDTEKLIEDSRPEARLQELRHARETGYFTSPPDLDEYETSSTQGPPSPRGGDDDDDWIENLGGYPVDPYKVRVKQRYDAINSDEVSLSMGDIFDVLAEIDENWGIAELHGNRGMFPLNHVERMRRAGH